MSSAAADATGRADARSAPADLVAFCERERPRLVGTLTLYTGDVLVAEELAQEALLAACRSWRRVRAMDSPGGWVHRAAMNLANSRFRRRRAESRALRRDDGARAEYQLPDVPAAMRVREAVRALPTDQRAVIVLRFYADLPVAQVAAVMGRSDGAVRALTHRAIRRLRDHGLAIEEEEVRDA